MIVATTKQLLQRSIVPGDVVCIDPMFMNTPDSRAKTELLQKFRSLGYNVAFSKFCGTIPFVKRMYNL